MKTTKITPDYIFDDNGTNIKLTCNHCQKVICEFPSHAAGLVEHTRKGHQSYYKHIPFKNQ